MKNLKALFVICLALLSQVVFAGEWNQLEMNQSGYHLKISYTKRFVTPTYGTNGGVMTGKLYLDLYTKRAAAADGVAIYEQYTNGTVTKVSQGSFIEASNTHHWVQLDRPSYAGTLSIGKVYLLKVLVDGRIVEFEFRLN